MLCKLETPLFRAFKSLYSSSHYDSLIIARIPTYNKEFRMFTTLFYFPFARYSWVHINYVFLQAKYRTSLPDLKTGAACVAAAFGGPLSPNLLLVCVCVCVSNVNRYSDGVIHSLIISVLFCAKIHKWNKNLTERRSHTHACTHA